jgi:hypothetical protein
MNNGRHEVFDLRKFTCEIFLKQKNGINEGKIK